MLADSLPGRQRYINNYASWAKSCTLTVFSYLVLRTALYRPQLGGGRDELDCAFELTKTVREE